MRRRHACDDDDDARQPHPTPTRRPATTTRRFLTFGVIHRAPNGSGRSDTSVDAVLRDSTEASIFSLVRTRAPRVYMSSYVHTASARVTRMTGQFSTLSLETTGGPALTDCRTSDAAAARHHAVSSVSKSDRQRTVVFRSLLRRTAGTQVDRARRRARHYPSRVRTV